MALEKMSHRQDEFNARNVELTAAHDAVGERRAEVEATLSSMGSGDEAFAVSVRFGRGVARVDASGLEIEIKKTGSFDEEEDDAQLNARLLRAKTINPKLVSALKGAAFGNKKIGGITMPCGVCLILGGGGSGKTPLAHALARASRTSEYGAVRIGEPLSGYSSSQHETAFDIAQGMVMYSDVVVDSIKDLLASGGNLMKAGISRDVLTTVSEWSSLACDMGVTLYVPINPSSVDDDVVALLAEAARSNATSTILHKGNGKWDYFGRTGEGLDRIAGHIDFSKNGLRTNGESTQINEEQVVELVVANVNTYRGALHRAIVSKQ